MAEVGTEYHNETIRRKYLGRHTVASSFASCEVAAGRSSAAGPPRAAQVKLGELSTSLNGTISTGYTATYGNMTEFTHGWTLGGDSHPYRLLLQPQFSFLQHLSLSEPIAGQLQLPVHLQCQRSQCQHQYLRLAANSPVQSAIPRPTTPKATTRFPGIADFVTHGNSHNFGVNWSANIPDKPTFPPDTRRGTARIPCTAPTIRGTNSFHSFNLHSAYSVAGFNLGADYRQWRRTLA